MMDPTLRERLAAMVAAYDEMQAAPDGPDHMPVHLEGPIWQAAINRYHDLIGEVPGHLGLARLVLELDAEVQRLRASEAALKGTLKRTTDHWRAHQRFADEVGRLLASPGADRLSADDLEVLLDVLRARLTG